MSDPRQFLSGFAAYSDLLFCAKADSSAGDTPRPGEFPFSTHTLDGDSWAQHKKVLNWPPVALASVKPPGKDRVLVAIGANGSFYEGNMGDLSEQTGLMPDSDSFIARNLAVVADTIYAVGMGHAFARRDGPMTWTRLDPQIPPGTEGAAGFNDLVGFTRDEMYTVGWGGEILRTDGRRWQRVDSPVSAALRAACIAPDGLVYAVGYNGAMVKGRGDEWTVIDTGRNGVLLDICAFKDDIFVATSFEVLRLTPDGLAPVTEFEDPEDRPGSCVALCPAADGSAVFWLGGPDLFRITDTTWHRVPT